MSLFQGSRILIVDDEKDIRKLLDEEFSSNGAVTFQEEDGKKAFEFIKLNPVDIVFTDMKMPGGDGMTLIKNINEHIKPTPIIFLCTGFSEYSSEEVKKLGVMEVFGKPFSWDHITSSISNAINSRK